MNEEIPTYYCRKIKSQVMAEKPYDITGRIFVQCKYFSYGLDNLCFKDFPETKKCLIIKLAVQRETREKKAKLVN